MATSHKDVADIYSKNKHDKPGGSFFTVNKHKAPPEYGVWARSKAELVEHLNKIRCHFTSVVEEI